LKSLGWYRRVKRDVTNCYWILAATLQQQYVNSGFTLINDKGIVRPYGNQILDAVKEMFNRF
jgi:hypothetical protein